MKRFLLPVFLLIFAALSFALLQPSKHPSALYLTWLHDPTTTMTVQWHSEEKETPLFYKKKREANWLEKEGSAHLVKNGTLFWGELFVHTVELTGLEPDTDYTFRLGDGRPYQFRTMPQSGGRPIHFVVGGDVYQDDIFLLKKMNAQVAKMDPDFVVLGGDIAYTRGHSAFLKGRYFEMRRWHTFLKNWKRQMVTSDGRLIPMLVVVGNHDLSSSHPSPQKAPILFYELFKFPETLISYRALDFGSDLSLFLLDTAHTYPIGGEQARWLEEALKARGGQTNKVAIYHVGAYPSFTSNKRKASRNVRKHWVPLFEQYGLRCAFEHHDHAYKRTFPLKGDEINPEGVTYFGDGGWAAGTRTPKKPQERWYLAKTARINFVYLVTVQKNNLVVQAIDNEGDLFDETTFAGR